MKKNLLTVLFSVVCITFSYAGGLLTNTNQSAHFLRNPARGASMEIDAVYTNPAGLAKLANDGLHFSLNNQSAFQTRTITSTFAPFALNGGSATREFEGTAQAPFIPSLLAAYKTGDWVFSGSFGIVGGGGTLTFKNGLPSFEALVAGQTFESLNMLNDVAAQTGYAGAPLGYSLNMHLEGTSITYDAQLGTTYRINDMFSVFAGARAAFVRNGFVGNLNNVEITNANAVRTHLTAVADGLETAGQAEQAAQLRGAAQGIEGLEQGVSATELALDTRQSGWGITPILGVNFNHNRLNIGVKYEFITRLSVENNTTINTTPMPDFDDGVRTPHDIPALLTIGAQYDILPSVTISAGYHHFFDSNARMANNKQNYINGGINEYLFGVEWRINNRLLISGGGQITRTGVTDAYQSDLSYSLHSFSLGFGGAVNITENVRVNLAYLWTGYEDWTKRTEFMTDVFAQTNRAFAVGIDFRF